MITLTPDMTFISDEEVDFHNLNKVESLFIGEPVNLKDGVYKVKEFSYEVKNKTLVSVYYDETPEGQLTLDYYWKDGSL